MDYNKSKWIGVYKPLIDMVFFAWEGRKGPRAAP